MGDTGSVNGYVVIFEGKPGAYGAYVPDLPGCVAVGSELSEVERLIAEAIAFHLSGMREDGEPVPAPSAQARIVIPAIA